MAVDDEVAVILVQEGFSTIEEVGYVATSELIEIEEFDEDIVEELRNRARDYLLSKAISSVEGGDEPEDDLYEVEGVDEELAARLAENGILSRDDLAELGADELVEMVEMDEAEAGKLIMAARAHWFADEQADAEKDPVLACEGQFGASQICVPSSGVGALPGQLNCQRFSRMRAERPLRERR